MGKDSQKRAVGVVIPVYRTPTAYLKELFDSTCGEMEADDQVVWVDDGSFSNDLDSWFAKNLPKDKHAVIRLERNRGVAAAMNRGIEHLIHCEFIVTMGSDDIFFPNYVRRAKQALVRNTKVDVVVPQIELFETQTGVLRPSRSALWLARLWNRNHIPAGSMFRRKMWEKLGGFDESLLGTYEDWDFWVRARLSGHRFKLFKGIGYRYRVRPDSVSRQVNFKRARQTLRKKWLRSALGI